MAKRRYKGKTAEQKKKEIEDLTDNFLEKLDSYFESEEALEEHLKFMSSFYRYSSRNMTLIDDQFMGARAVGSYNFWKEKGANVKKGEKGIKILVPTPVEFFKRDDDWVQKRYANEKEKQGIKDGTIETKTKTFFKVGHVFEYTQTNAREKGLEVSDIFGKYHRDGTIEYDKAMMNSLNKVADNLNVTILDEPKHELGTAKGASYPYANEIALNPRNTDYENVTVLIHELAHAKLHTRETRGNYSTEEKEFQAEMVSHVVASHYDIDTEDFSLSYLHGWTQGKELNDKENLLNEVKQTSKEFIDIIDQNLEQEINKERSLSMNDKVNVRSFEGAWSDEFELATITYTNGKTGKEHNFSIWSTSLEGDESKITKEDVKYNDVILTTGNFDSDEPDTFREGAVTNMDEVNLYDLIDTDDNGKIEQTIADYYNGDIDDFNIEIPPENQRVDPKKIIIDSEMTDLMLKAEIDDINYDDIVELGKTLEDFDIDEFDFNLPTEILENDFNKELIVTNPHSIREEDLPYINTAFEKLGVEKHKDFSENIINNESLFEENEQDNKTEQDSSNKNKKENKTKQLQQHIADEQSMSM